VRMLIMGLISGAAVLSSGHQISAEGGLRNSPIQAAWQRPSDRPKGLAAARAAFVARKYSRAIELSKPLAEGSPNEAWRVLGASACMLKDKREVNKALAHLDAEGQSLVRYSCTRHRVAVK
jgi:hypothetical protein